MALFGLIKERQLPYLEDLTVSHHLTSQLGFKSNQSSYWLVMDPKGGDSSDRRGDRDQVSFVAKEVCRLDPGFRGVFCWAGMESIPNITADLQKYCKMTNQPGMVYCNGQRIDVNAEGEVVKSKTPQARSAEHDI